MVSRLSKAPIILTNTEAKQFDTAEGPALQGHLLDKWFKGVWTFLTPPTLEKVDSVNVLL